MAFFKGSPYETLPPFDRPEDGSAGFRGIRPRPIGVPEPVLEHSVAVADRLDALGQHYYANPRDWRRIADANPEALFAEDLILAPASPAEPAAERLGEVVLIPRRKEGAR